MDEENTTEKHKPEDNKWELDRPFWYLGEGRGWGVGDPWVGNLDDYDIIGGHIERPPHTSWIKEMGLLDPGAYLPGQVIKPKVDRDQLIADLSRDVKCEFDWKPSANFYKKFTADKDPLLTVVGSHTSVQSDSSQKNQVVQLPIKIESLASEQRMKPYCSPPPKKKVDCVLPRKEPPETKCPEDLGQDEVCLKICGKENSCVTRRIKCRQCQEIAGKYYKIHIEDINPHCFRSFLKE